jgi:RNA polymerase-binding transcription factor DksA
MTIDLEHFKKKLLEEKAALEKELEQVGIKDPTRTNWEARPADTRDISSADENTVADAIEGYEENNAITNTLEARYKDIVSGLDKIEKGVYGKCQVCQKDIELARLEANPAARTCIEHMS